MVATSTRRDRIKKLFRMGSPPPVIYEFYRSLFQRANEIEGVPSSARSISAAASGSRRCNSRSSTCGPARTSHSSIQRCARRVDSKIDPPWPSTAFPWQSERLSRTHILIGLSVNPIGDAERDGRSPISKRDRSLSLSVGSIRRSTPLDETFRNQDPTFRPRGTWHPDLSLYSGRDYLGLFIPRSQTPRHGSLA